MKTILLFLALSYPLIAGEVLISTPFSKESHKLSNNTSVNIRSNTFYKINLNDFKYQIKAKNSGQSNKLNGELKILVNGQVWVNTKIINSDKIIADTGEVILDPTDIVVKEGQADIIINWTGDTDNFDGSITINGSTQEDPPPVYGELYMANYCPEGVKPILGWRVIRNGEYPTSGIGGPEGVGIVYTPPNTYDDGQPFNGHQNNGHGNNYDGVDISNPGKGKGGPTGLKNSGLDPSTPVDDEIRKKLNKES